MKSVTPIRVVKIGGSIGPSSPSDSRQGRAAFLRIPGLPILGEANHLLRHLLLGNGAATLQKMRRAGSMFLVLLAMSWVALPALACLLPGPATTAAERACCQKMPQMCGSAQMPQSHSCCQTVRPGNTSVLRAHYQSAPALQVIATWSEPSRIPRYAIARATADRPPSDSPPGSSILRI